MRRRIDFKISMAKGALSFLLLSVLILSGCSSQNQNRIIDEDLLPESISDDGAWCWFSSPRAIYIDAADKSRQILTGWMKSDGSVEAAMINPVTGVQQNSILHSEFQVDDHDNPAFLQLEDGRLMAFYSRHSYKGGLNFRRSKNSGDITQWESEKTLTLNDEKYYQGSSMIPKGYIINHYSYVNPYRLSKVDNRIYLFWRGYHYKPNISWSDDEGESWHQGRIMVMEAEGSTHVRPYVRYYSDGDDTIHILFTDGHPRNENKNSVYYAALKGDQFFRADGSLICSIDQLPFTPQDADLVYDASETNERAWVWDIVADDNGHPVIAYTRLPTEKDHQYYIARYSVDGDSVGVWTHLKIADGGRWFPQTPALKNEPEPHYSGGISIDPENWRQLYFSSNKKLIEIESSFNEVSGNRKNRFLVYSAVVNEQMSNAIINPIDPYTRFDQVRPVTVRGERPEGAPSVLWMENLWYVHYTDYRSLIRLK